MTETNLLYRRLKVMAEHLRISDRLIDGVHWRLVRPCPYNPLCYRWLDDGETIHHDIDVYMHSDTQGDHRDFVSAHVKVSKGEIFQGYSVAKGLLRGSGYARRITGVFDSEHPDLFMHIAPDSEMVPSPPSLPPDPPLPPAPPLPPPPPARPAPEPPVVWCGCKRHCFSADRDPYEAHRIYVAGLREDVGNVLNPISKLGTATPAALLVDIQHPDYAP